MGPEDFQGNLQRGNGRGRGAQNGQQAGTPGGQEEKGLSKEAVCTCLTANFPAEALSEAEKESLLFMAEEEKLARDVYLELFAKWQSPAFSNIAGSEQRHMNAIACLLSKYQVEDPAGNNAAGVFKNETLQKLYAKLLADGSVSLEAAFTVGATIEDLDISDLLKASEEADNQDIKAVYAELTKGSRNHLRAFTRNLGNLEASYTPQYLSKELFDEILSQDQERGGSICGTCSNGQGSNGKGAGGGNCNNGTGAGKGNNGKGRGRG
ncbi:MAG: DUF2202 domain-containing protein [Haliscomenobacter sp.]|nr:DUF2202 domain-containing protein [Haliscomenobacter sp.]MBK7477163.1 DUF2202 domain-containing protein [Haliscomenobacter sp.]MBK8878660.1 DUF2202 domain-containing protein [Haliscomenobacter sp.]